MLTDAPRATAPLAAVIPMHAVAALLGVDTVTFAKRVRKGSVAAAVHSFESTGYVFGWRAVVALLIETLDGPELARALERLLALRAGTMRAVEGQFQAVPVLRSAPTDELSDATIVGIVQAAAGAGATSSPTAFDQWLMQSGYGWNHRDAVVRLSADSWESMLRFAGVELEDLAVADDRGDINDPLTALKLAALNHGAGNGRELSAVKFDDWARDTGSRIRSHDVRNTYGGWNAAKTAAGLEVSDHPTQRHT